MLWFQWASERRNDPRIFVLRIISPICLPCESLRKFFQILLENSSKFKYLSHRADVDFYAILRALSCFPRLASLCITKWKHFAWIFFSLQSASVWHDFSSDGYANLVSKHVCFQSSLSQHNLFCFSDMYCSLGDSWHIILMLFRCNELFDKISASHPSWTLRYTATHAQCLSQSI